MPAPKLRPTSPSTTTVPPVMYSQQKTGRLVEYVGEAVGHARAEVAPDLTQHHDRAAGHVLAAVASRALDDRDRAGVPHREPIARASGREQRPTGRAVQGGVAENHVAGGQPGVRRIVKRLDDDVAAR